MTFSIHYLCDPFPFLCLAKLHKAYATYQLSVWLACGQMEGLGNSMPHEYFISQRVCGYKQIRRGQKGKAAYGRMVSLSDGIWVPWILSENESKIPMLTRSVVKQSSG